VFAGTGMPSAEFSLEDLKAKRPDHILVGAFAGILA
jgi:hypothetical protein